MGMGMGVGSLRIRGKVGKASVVRVMMGIAVGVMMGLRLVVRMSQKW
jgi:hypothetical protein